MFVTVCFLIDWHSELLSSDGQINKDVRNNNVRRSKKKKPARLHSKTLTINIVNL